jgi:hypothetical protein
LFVSENVLLTVAVTAGTNPPSTGLEVTCDVSAIGGSSAQGFYDDGTNGDLTAGDNTFSYSTSIAMALPPATKPGVLGNRCSSPHRQRKHQPGCNCDLAHRRGSGFRIRYR